MRILKTLIVFILAFFTLNTLITFAGVFDTSSTPTIPYCETGNCSLKKGVEFVKGGVYGIEYNRSFSQYVQDVVKYLLTFVSLLAVIYIIYAGFKIFTSSGNEEGIKKGKNIIIYVIIGIIVMWLAFSLVKWIIDLVNNA